MTSAPRGRTWARTSSSTTHAGRISRMTGARRTWSTSTRCRRCGPQPDGLNHEYMGSTETPPAAWQGPGIEEVQTPAIHLPWPSACSNERSRLCGCSSIGTRERLHPPTSICLTLSAKVKFQGRPIVRAESRQGRLGVESGNSASATLRPAQHLQGHAERRSDHPRALTLNRSAKPPLK